MVEASDLLDAVKSTVKKAVTELPDDIVNSLRKAYELEEEELPKRILHSILDNIDLAKRTTRPMCQDTGVPMFFVKLGRRFNFRGDLYSVIKKAIAEATYEIPLRPNAVNPFTNVNSGDNTGCMIPYVEYELYDSDEMEITYMPKGAGSENQSQLLMLNPSEGLRILEEKVFELVVNRISQTCPPGIIGIGLGGGGDIALALAKKALLRPVGSRNPDKIIANLERDMLTRINTTGIGPMGLGGKTTALDVHIEYAHRHPASFPVGIVFQCWAARRAKLVVRNNGDYTII